ncbi:hypothetical protein [Krasilnikoviella flava]|uniref:Uncharacterized protein n=1 Tax=Krasilnikoviella flava TaxID=526729 RepID=A0A1T5IQK1_9MICO|nr:hypothetical protein [Krasilnikoviella flava]SKC41464.1 hypothetical protein SAMN04324258_0816 [Krasilnikoviella flava]
MSSELGDGWTIERVRDYANDPTATELSLDRDAHFDDGSIRVHLQPSAIVKVGGLVLVRDDDDWYMGQTDARGAVICWGSYGRDLGGAIDGL